MKKARAQAMEREIVMMMSSPMEVKKTSWQARRKVQEPTVVIAPAMTVSPMLRIANSNLDRRETWPRRRAWSYMWPGQEKGNSTSLQRGRSARARSKERRSRSRPFREMITRPKISRNEWKTTEIGAFEVGIFAPFSCPGRDDGGGGRGPREGEAGPRLEAAPGVAARRLPDEDVAFFVVVAVSAE